MKVCPFCLEEVRDAAAKCRYCSSSLLSGEVPSENIPVEPNKIVYVIDRDTIRFAKRAFWVLTLLAAIAVLFYLYGFHLTKVPPKSDQLVYTYVLDEDLVRFAKFAGAVLAVFVDRKSVV